MSAHGRGYDGLLGFSQGANLATLLLALAEAGVLDGTKGPEVGPRDGEGIDELKGLDGLQGAPGGIPDVHTGLQGWRPRFAVLVCGSAFGWAEQWATADRVDPR